MRRARHWPFGPGASAGRWSYDEMRNRTRVVARERDGWEVTEAAPGGETILEDLRGCEEDGPGAARVLTRYLVLRLLLQRLQGRLGRWHGAERTAAARYLAVSAPLSPPTEADALRALIRVTDPRSAAAAACESLMTVAWHALRQRHRESALAYCRTAYTLGAQVPEASAVAARAAALLARLADGARSGRAARLWLRRAAVLERRAARWREALAGPTTEPGSL
jgi:hypothetical protein